MGGVSMMKVQKGQVKYKDRSDIICTYGIAEDGKQYYFLDGKKLDNGSFIASTALVEAIDPLVIASNVGVVSEEGEIIVPFKNKTIKLISDQALLVEKVEATTQSVIEAINMRKDPLAATKLVTTPATIKDRINAKMGSGGRFVFNDQFSEATVVDLDGNNLIGDDYYSFIGINHDTLYLSKNTVDSEIVSYSLSGDKDEENHSGETLDVKDAVIEKDVIDQAMKVDEPILPTPIIPPVPVVSIKDEETKEQDDELFHPITFQEIEVNDDEEASKEEDNVFNKNLENEPEVSLFEGLAFDEKERPNKFVDSSIDEDDSDNDTIIEDAAVMLDKLIKKNKEQKKTILAYERKMDDLVSFKKQAFNENQKLSRDNDNYKKRIEELEREVSLANEKVEKLSSELAGKDDLARLLVDAKDLLDD